MRVVYCTESMQLTLYLTDELANKRPTTSIDNSKAYMMDVAGALSR